jgi:choline dehydrogenase-like flavoprotein
MIDDARKIAAGTRIEADLCILGGGPAAIATALEYMKSGKSVVLVPGGGPSQTPSAIDLYRGRVTPSGSHEPIEENRLRMWGGTGTVWGGRLVPFDSIDYEQRDWVPHSGWPIDPDEITRYLGEACALSEGGAAAFDARQVFPDRQAELIRGFDNQDFATWPLERWSVPTDYSRRYDNEFRETTNARVLLHAHCTHIQLEPDGGSVDHVRVACRPGHEFQVSAERFVLACGALENARLLLASRDVATSGIGNAQDLVGRYYQSHRFGVCGTAELKLPAEGFIYDFEKDPEGVYCRRRFWLTPEAQKKHQTLNAIGFFFRTVSSGAEHRNALVSTVLLTKTLLGGAKKGPRRFIQIIRDQRKEMLLHFWIILKDGPSVFRQLFEVAYTRLIQKRRLPMVLPPKKINRFPLFFQTEHAPNPKSRVLLDETSKDEYGMPRLDVRVCFSDLDFRTIRTFVLGFKERLEASGLGELHLSDTDKQFLDNPSIQRFNSNSHNIGTTRMSADTREGVVDTDCKIHGVANLYVAGSSVFPTSSHANPTLMIIALALRLARHLRAKEAEPTAF